ncbi:MAG: conserved protein of unknown function; putative YcgN protein [uncultured Thiotrichaceae bacterium]|uniref:UPF0260 protein HELGO_WM10580 n=1 Tax=uncultured Thiotrichaceae bacterium TaxID=298394 RepID=A0A6S6SED7_9GAMM|nr:MAG: conserved protein of unknown function; putative YcgN protein [uncultured Thiotrichaceae bacterium]
MNKWWEEKRLSALSREEWESLCDHCGKCCLLKLEDEDTGDVYYTDVACSLVDAKSCHCGNYSERETLVPDCLKLTPDNLEQLAWMPLSCAYRRIMEGRGLPEWHHLVCGSKDEIHRQGLSIKGRYVDENEVRDIQEHIVEWPLIEGN